jgi:hypothetical protein
MAVHALLLGIVAGVSAGGRDVPGGLLAVALGALFLPLVAALSTLAHPRLAVAARRRALALGAAAAGLGLLALGHGPVRELAAVGAAGALAGGGYVLARVRAGPRSMATELVAIGGISLLAPAAWLLVAGAAGRWPLAPLAAFLAFGGTVPYVRERIRRRRGPAGSLGERLRGGLAALVWQGVALAGAGGLALSGTVGALLPVAFLPGALKTAIALARPESRPSMKRIGYLETAISTVFALLAGLALGTAR